MDIESDLKVIEKKIDLSRQKETCLTRANDILDDYEKRLSGGEKITSKHSQEVQDQWDKLPWGAIELSKREDFNKRFFLLIDKITDKELDKKIISREKIINKLESYLEPFSSIVKSAFKDEREWEDF